MTGTEPFPFRLAGTYTGENGSSLFTALFADNGEHAQSKSKGFFFPVRVWSLTAANKSDAKQTTVLAHESNRSDICGVTASTAAALGLDLAAPERFVWVRDYGGIQKRLPAFTLAFDLPGGARVSALACVGCVANQLGDNAIGDRSVQKVDGARVYGVQVGEETWQQPARKETDA